MAYQPHATQEQLTQWAADNDHDLQIPSNTARYLTAASMLVDEYAAQCRTPQVDDYLDPWVAELDEEPLTEATIVQAAYWLRNQVAPLEEDVQAGSKVVASASLLSGSMTFADAQAASSARAQASRQLCYEARLTLNMAGIRPAQPFAIG